MPSVQIASPFSLSPIFFSQPKIPVSYLNRSLFFHRHPSPAFRESSRCQPVGSPLPVLLALPPHFPGCRPCVPIVSIEHGTGGEHTQPGRHFIWMRLPAGRPEPCSILSRFEERALSHFVHTTTTPSATHLLSLSSPVWNGTRASLLSAGQRSPGKGHFTPPAGGQQARRRSQ